MNRTFTLALSVAAAAAVLLSGKSHAQAGAPPIDGNINFASGFLTFDTGNIATAHSVTSFSNVVVGTATGAYGALSNAVVTWTPFLFNPAAPSVKPLWSVSTNGLTYSFDATSVSLIFQNSGYVNLRGAGVAHITGYADTPGTWTLAALLNGSKYTFSATSMSTNSLIPTITFLGSTNGNFSFSWNSAPGQTYQVQFATNLPATNWQNLGDAIVATGSTVTTNDNSAPTPRRFYRVVLQD